MDIQQFIGNDAPDFLCDQSQEHGLPLDFYDRNSDDEQPVCQLTVYQTVHILAARLNITDMPLTDVVEEAVRAYNLSPQQVGEFARKIKKTKNIMKRRRAKNRQPCEENSFAFEKKTLVFQQSSTEKDTFVVEKQIKKQRNRLSAQISRDKKKCYLNELQLKNKQLTLEAENLRLENQRLRNQMQARKNIDGDKNKKQSNKLMRLLVFLGIIFFVYIVKDIFSGQTRKNQPSLVNAKAEGECPQLASVSSSRILSEISRQISDLATEDYELEVVPIVPGKVGFKQILTKKISELTSKMKSFMLPGKLASSLLLSKQAFTL